MRREHQCNTWQNSPPQLCRCRVGNDCKLVDWEPLHCLDTDLDRLPTLPASDTDAHTKHITQWKTEWIGKCYVSNQQLYMWANHHITGTLVQLYSLLWWRQVSCCVLTLLLLVTAELYRFKHLTSDQHQIKPMMLIWRWPTSNLSCDHYVQYMYQLSVTFLRQDRDC